MTEKLVYDGSDVTEAIKKACGSLSVTQDQLDIEVVRTGTNGIFGFMRRSAQVRVSLRGQVAAEGEATPAKASTRKKKAAPRAQTAPAKAPAPAGPIDPEIFRAVETELGAILERMGFPATITATQEGDKVVAHIAGEHEAEIVGSEGQTLDALQFLIRKIISRKFPGRVLVALDAGNFREVRRQDLVETAQEMAEQVKESGKTRMMPPLNPSERRIVHMALQQDTTIRSRSVGDGIFKKVLIFLPNQARKKGGGRQRKNPAASKEQ